jgi:hypothetical protein
MDKVLHQLKYFIRLVSFLLPLYASTRMSIGMSFLLFSMMVIWNVFLFNWLVKLKFCECYWTFLTIKFGFSHFFFCLNLLFISTVLKLISPFFLLILSFICYPNSHGIPANRKELWGMKGGTCLFVC